jgi:hypothetical protein
MNDLFTIINIQIHVIMVIDAVAAGLVLLLLLLTMIGHVMTEVAAVHQRRLLLGLLFEAKSIYFIYPRLYHNFFF